MNDSIINDNQKFDLEKFLNKQDEIYKKFIPPTACGTSLEKFDKLLINLLEEVVEYGEEFNNITTFKYDYKEDLKNELVDVIMYIGTCIVCWKNEYPEIYKNIFEKYKNISYEPFDIGAEYFSKNSNYTYKIIFARSGFSERKWHKPHKGEDNSNDVKNILSLLYNMLIYSINQLYYYDDFMEKVIERIEKKQDYILNL